MMPPEEEDEAASSNPQEVPDAPSWPSAEKSSAPDPVPAQDKLETTASSRASGHQSSSQRDRAGRNDDQYHRSDNRERDRSYRDRDRDRERDRERDRDRDRDRDRNRDRSYRDRNYGSSRPRESYRERDDRYDRRDRRDRRSRSPEERSVGRGAGSRKHSSRSRSRSKEPRSRDAGRDQQHRGSTRRSPREDRGSASSREGAREQRVTQDRLSAEIELELANLRRQHDLKEAAKKEQAKEKDGKKLNNRPKKLVPAFTVLKPQKPDFVPFDAGPAETDAEYVPEIQTEEERIEFQRKMQEKLQQHLAAEGKLYPPPAKPKCEPPPPTAVSGFANDGSFLEMFKKFQEQQVVSGSVAAALPTLPVSNAAALVPGGSNVDVSVMSATATAGVVMPNHSAVAQNPQLMAATTLVTLPVAKSVPVAKPLSAEPPPPPLPVFGRRRGGKILKTGMVKKVRPIEESAVETPNDPWSLYLQEVKKYKSASCDADSKTRPLVK